MTDISLHTLEYTVIDVQNDLVQCSNLLAQIQRAVKANDGDLASNKLSQLQPIISHIQDFKFPYYDLETQAHEPYTRLKSSIAEIVDVYRSFQLQIPNMAAAAAAAAADQHADEDPLTSHGTLGGLQYSIQHTPVSSEAVEMQRLAAEERELEIQRISQSVNDINTIFTDLDTMVTSQGGVISQIENSIFNTIDHLRNGDNQLQRAESWQRKTSSCQRLLLIITMIVVVIILLVLFV